MPWILCYYSHFVLLVVKYSSLATILLFVYFVLLSSFVRRYDFLAYWPNQSSTSDVKSFQKVILSNWCEWLLWHQKPCSSPPPGPSVDLSCPSWLMTLSSFSFSFGFLKKIFARRLYYVPQPHWNRSIKLSLINKEQYHGNYTRGESMATVPCFCDLVTKHSTSSMNDHHHLSRKTFLTHVLFLLLD